MAHFAELDSTNKVLRVVYVDNANVPSDMHADGETWCENNIPEDPSIAYVNGSYPGVAWKQTSYNHSFRKRFAAIGGYFIDDGSNGYFTGFKQYDNWVLNTNDGAYYPPVALPSVQEYTESGKRYQYYITWDQANTRYTAVKVAGNANPYWRLNITNLNADKSNYEEGTEIEEVNNPASDLTQIRVWNPDTSSWS